MLAQILPGFRDFRTPLVTGYLWLTVFWVAVGMPVPSPDGKTGPLGLINWLNGYTSSTAMLAVLSFLAFLVGILLSIDIKQANWIMLHFGFSRHIDDDGTPSIPRRYVRSRRNLPYRQSLMDETYQTILNIVRSTFTGIEQRGVPWQRLYRSEQLDFPDEVDVDIRIQESYTGRDEVNSDLLRDAFITLLPRLAEAIQDEIPVLATKLQEKSERLFETYDRARSEAEFRLSVAPPILALAIASGIALFVNGNLLRGNGSLVLGLLVFATLLIKGWAKLQESSSIVVTALEIGTVQSEAIEGLEALPAE